MEDKFYCPDISEFHSGFRFQTLNSKGLLYYESMPENEWVDNGMDFGILGDINNIQRLLLSKQIRVKYLSKSDIEDLGWEFIDKTQGTANNLYFEKVVKNYLNENEIVKLYFLPEGIEVEWCWNVIVTGKRERNFQGRIKNKSEFKKILTMIGIK